MNENQRRMLENEINECNLEIHELTEANKTLEADNNSGSQQIRTLNEAEIQRLVRDRSVAALLLENECIAIAGEGSGWCV
jgi:septal ring factor EnvC (AmiA/AmiB activator)